MLRIEDRELPVDVRTHPTARRMTLRVDRASGRLRLTLPPGVGVAEGLQFAERHRGWVRARLAELPDQVPFADGARLPILGDEHEVRHRPEMRAGVWREAGVIHVSGAGEHLPRRLRDFLRKEARTEIAPRVRDLATRVGRPAGRITLRDTSSRWGSCTARGDLSFSWRLIFAPEAVLHYVVAHEVAHLVHLNHGPKFWALVDELIDDVAGPRRWLRRHGAELMRYG
ncbi:M48 family metallopeptidase [Ferruginivarius sediminum]|nr:SprT family zinc-dependent metalloprotease [Ferruginivarius sediminum]